MQVFLPLNATTVSRFRLVVTIYPHVSQQPQTKKHEKSWNEMKTAVTLHQKSEMISIFDLLTQNKYKGLTISTLSA